MRQFKPLLLMAALPVLNCSAYEKADDAIGSESPAEYHYEEAEGAPAPVAEKNVAVSADSKAKREIVSKPDLKPAEPQLDPNTSEGYKDYGVNPMTDASKDRFSTFSIDVDTGSYTITRKKLLAGVNVPKSAVRVEEFINYFRYDYPSPDDGVFGVHMEAAPSPFTAEEDTYLLRIGIQGKRLTQKERKPVHLTFLVDVSGSMNRPDKLPLAQKAMKILTNNLREGDTVAMATYAGRTEKILDPTGIEKKGAIVEAIAALTSGGGTGMNSGMETAYNMAMQNFKKDHVNRVIVLSDGDANIGPSSHDDILRSIRKYAEEGVTLSTIGLGMGNYKDTMMEQLANKGNGNYYYIDSEKEARKVFGEQLDGTLQVIAKDVKIQVEFDPDKIPEYRLIGYENRDIADEDFRNDAVDAGEIGAGHSVTALYEVKVNDTKGDLATVRIRAKRPDGHVADEMAFPFTSGDVRTKIGATSKDFQFQTAVAQFAEILRESPYAKKLTFDLVTEVAKGGMTGREEDRNEFLKLIAQAKKLH